MHDPGRTLDTATSFVLRLSQSEPQAWGDFAVHYSRMMRKWMKPWKIPADDIDDILQDTSENLFGQLLTRSGFHREAWEMLDGAERSF